MSSSAKGSGRTVPVTVRLTEDQVSLIERKAEAAGMSRSAYLVQRLSGEDLEQHPTLAALGRVIAIHETVRANGRTSADQLHELQSILAQFAQLARAEVLR
ncbi:plasmid mobilization protein [Sphingosinicella sp. LY1275]|uniref:plasmid mobilization protein n=1 Tax=Sphingosinicella sp. LY1275 TaxID=3095379 RepID=UPI002ADEF31A|nr:hypothetical protein [Sphingosinicella sp. LY1275]MEA1015326.1 hypothetical protein [Sphingosinicella sp. LY1275]